MIEVIFNFNKNELSLHRNKNEIIKNIINKYASMIQKNIDSLNFIYNNNEINKELTLDNLINKKETPNQNEKIYIFVYEKKIVK